MTEQQIDEALEHLVEGEKTWASLSLAARRGLLEEVRALTVRHAAEWVDAAVGIKGLDPSSPLVGEEWMSGPYSLAAGLGALAESLAKLKQVAARLTGPSSGMRPAAARQ